ncbi:hypothetical protein HPNQ4228_0442 [Helicobacter pylori NQ4228]|nr:hypothetical protein HPNQ4228_0442 [Helicobacter pylori NQ4228]
MIIKGFYHTHSLPFLDWYFKGLSSFQTLKRVLPPTTLSIARYLGVR